MRLRSNLLAAGAALSLTVLGSAGLAGASEDLPAGDYTIDVPGVGTVAFTVAADGGTAVTALPEGFELGAGEEVEVEDLSLTVDGTVYDVEFEAENDDDDGSTTEIEAEATEDDEDDETGVDDDTDADDDTEVEVEVDDEDADLEDDDEDAQLEDDVEADLEDDEDED